MKRNAWRKIIKQECESAGTFQPFFESVIDTLAGILEMRDEAQRKFKASGGEIVVTHVNKFGAENITKNPMLTIILECNSQALAYWKELGLTGKSYREIAGRVTDGSQTLESVLSKLGV